MVCFSIFHVGWDLVIQWEPSGRTIEKQLILSTMVLVLDWHAYQIEVQPWKSQGVVHFQEWQHFLEVLEVALFEAERIGPEEVLERLVLMLDCSDEIPFGDSQLCSRFHPAPNLDSESDKIEELLFLRMFVSVNIQLTWQISNTSKNFPIFRGVNPLTISDRVNLFLRMLPLKYTTWPFQISLILSNKITRLNSQGIPHQLIKNNAVYSVLFLRRSAPNSRRFSGLTQVIFLS